MTQLVGTLCAIQLRAGDGELLGIPTGLRWHLVLGARTPRGFVSLPPTSHLDLLLADEVIVFNPRFVQTGTGWRLQGCSWILS